MIPDAIRPALARLIGAAAAALVVTLMRHFGRELSPDVQGAVADVAVFAAFAVYAAVHKAVSARTNPTDAASPALAAVAATPPAEPATLAEHLEAAAEGGAPDAPGG